MIQINRSENKRIEIIYCTVQRFYQFEVLNIEYYILVPLVSRIRRIQYTINIISMLNSAKAKS